MQNLSESSSSLGTKPRVSKSYVDVPVREIAAIERPSTKLISRGKTDEFLASSSGQQYVAFVNINSIGPGTDSVSKGGNYAGYYNDGEEPGKLRKPGNQGRGGMDSFDGLESADPAQDGRNDVVRYLVSFIRHKKTETSHPHKKEIDDRLQKRCGSI